VRLFTIFMIDLQAEKGMKRAEKTCIDMHRFDIYQQNHVRERLISDLCDDDKFFASGLKWVNAGEIELPDHLELSNLQLSTALTSLEASFRELCFSQKEWQDFGIPELRHDSFVKAGSAYFVPEAAHIGQVFQVSAKKRKLLALLK